MSALGHKRTYAVQKGMSALPPKATVKADSRTTSCLLYQADMCSALHHVCFGPKADPKLISQPPAMMLNGPSHDCSIEKRPGPCAKTNSNPPKIATFFMKWLCWSSTWSAGTFQYAWKISAAMTVYAANASAAQRAFQ